MCIENNEILLSNSHFVIIVLDTQWTKEYQNTVANY